MFDLGKITEFWSIFRGSQQCSDRYNIETTAKSYSETSSLLSSSGTRNPLLNSAPTVVFFGRSKVRGNDAPTLVTSAGHSTTQHCYLILCNLTGFVCFTWRNGLLRITTGDSFFDAECLICIFYTGMCTYVGEITKNTEYGGFLQYGHPMVPPNQPFQRGFATYKTSSYWATPMFLRPILDRSSLPSLDVVCSSQVN